MKKKTCLLLLPLVIVVLLIILILCKKKTNEYFGTCLTTCQGEGLFSGNFGGWGCHAHREDPGCCHETEWETQGEMF